MLWILWVCSSLRLDFIKFKQLGNNQFLIFSKNKSLLSKSGIKQAWGKDALEFNPDRFDQENRHAYQEIVLIVEDFDSL